MLKLRFSVDTEPFKGYYFIKGTGYLTGNINGFTQTLSAKEEKE
mgnify:CR=1 FL=1